MRQITYPDNLWIEVHPNWMDACGYRNGESNELEVKEVHDHGDGVPAGCGYRVMYKVIGPRGIDWMVAEARVTRVFSK